ncbi:hypothetical protein C4D60_Mb06t01410 [Musa balbisiana]|uniref:Biotin and thiamin synthesis-associated domain-containing protein n=1 Tax=Musa balbisiana TaxID=52838 RepID=A0A4S8IJT4_MUSBA|nr:hypothetical protein C4D60_Mb06t01410 [Musa balbisiana]
MRWRMPLIRSLGSRLRPLVAPGYPYFSTSAAAVVAERTIRDEIKSIYDCTILDLLFHGLLALIAARRAMGGIIGLGEAEEDRVGLLHTLATLPTHPESVPINALVAVKGTPLQDQKPVEIWEMIRMIATARIVMPKAMVRLFAGRVWFSMPEQALCILAGANSIFTGEKLLTTPNNNFDADRLMFKILGLNPKAPTFSEAKEEAEEALEPEEAL